MSSDNAGLALNNIVSRGGGLPAQNGGNLLSGTLEGLVPGESPLDFIKKNLKPTSVTPTPVPPPAKDPLPPSPVPPTPAPEVKTEPTAEAVYPEDEIILPEFDDDKKDEPETPKETDIPEEPVDAPLEPVAENFKKLRTKLKETSTTLKTIQDENNKLKKEVEKFTTGEVVPDLIQEKENEIARLSRFEKLHNLKMSKEYQEKFIKPLTANETKLKEITKEYGIPDEHFQSFLNTALSIKDRPTLNRFLSEHFDEVGALEVKELITKTREVQEQAQVAEKEPGKVLEELKEEYEKIETLRRQEKIHALKEKSKDAWVKSLLKIREEGKVEELIIKENDPEHNKKWSTPIVTKAAQEYGKLVTMLADCGLENLPEEVGTALARMCQLAHATGAAVATRDAALQYAKELDTNTKRTYTMVRPPIGSVGANGSGGIPSAAPSSPTEAADFLLNKVLSTRK